MGHNQRMRIAKQRGKNEGRRTRRSRIGRARDFTDGQILQIPFPTGESAWQSAQHLSGSATLRAIYIAALTRCLRASYKRVSRRFSTGTPMVLSRRAIAGSNSVLVRIGDQQGQAVHQSFGIAHQQPRQCRIEGRDWLAQRRPKVEKRSCAINRCASACI